MDSVEQQLQQEKLKQERREEERREEARRKELIKAICLEREIQAKELKGEMEGLERVMRKKKEEDCRVGVEPKSQTQSPAQSSPQSQPENVNYKVFNLYNQFSLNSGTLRITEYIKPKKKKKKKNNQGLKIQTDYGCRSPVPLVTNNLDGGFNYEFNCRSPVPLVNNLDGFNNEFKMTPTTQMMLPNPSLQPTWLQLTGEIEGNNIEGNQSRGYQSQESDDEYSVMSPSSCRVCRIAPPDMIIFPCQHNAVCSDCWLKMKQKSGLEKCPICCEKISVCKKY